MKGSLALMLLAAAIPAILHAEPIQFQRSGGAAAPPYQANLQAGRIRFQSGEPQVSLLELYTSEGCSSCPPAEIWLAALKDSPGLWKTFVPIAFHVDYWNSPGWNDRWSAPEFTQRQNAYAAAWKSPDVYTPCLVLNGKEWHGWTSRRTPPGSSGGSVGTLWVSSTDTNQWNAIFFPAQTPKAGYEVHAALLAGGLSSDVKAGENRGRHLQHEFVALALAQSTLVTTNGAAKGKFSMDTSRYSSAKSLALAVWVTHAGEVQPLQAAGGWILPGDRTE